MKQHIFALILLLPVTAFAQEEATPKPSEYVPQRTSSFKPEGLRNAFIPIGYAAPDRTKPVDKPLIDSKMFKLTSTVIGDPSIAVINGRDHAEREWFEVSVSGKPVKVFLLKVSDGSVILYNENVGQITVSAPR